MHLFKRLTQHGCRFRAVLCERRHKLFRVQSRREAIATVHLLARPISDSTICGLVSGHFTRNAACAGLIMAMVLLDRI
jgi:hypothetical protein